MFDTESVLISPEMLTLVAEIDEFRGAWRALGTLAPERLSALRRVATIESIGSSTRIEGSRLSDREVELLLKNPETKNFATRDEQEVAGYAEMMETISRAWAEIPISGKAIKRIHRELLQFSEKDGRHRGEYKMQPNSVVAFDGDEKQIATVFETAAPSDTPQRMAGLIAWLKEALETRRLHPLLTIGIFIVMFLEIHPFQDGNGRVSRVLTTLLLLKAGYAYVQYSSLEGVIETSKEGYYLAMRATQRTLRIGTPDWVPWLLYFLRALQEQERRLVVKVEHERLVMAALPELDLRIIEFVREHGRATMAGAMRVTGANRNTLKVHLRSLVEMRHLARHGTGKGSWYGMG